MKGSKSSAARATLVALFVANRAAKKAMGSVTFSELLLVRGYFRCEFLHSKHYECYLACHPCDIVNNHNQSRIPSESGFRLTPSHVGVADSHPYAQLLSPFIENRKPPSDENSNVSQSRTGYT